MPSDPYVYVYAYAHAHQHTHAYAGHCRNGHPDEYAVAAIAHADEHPAGSYSDSYIQPHGHQHLHPNIHPYAHEHCHTYQHSNGNSYSDPMRAYRACALWLSIEHPGLRSPVRYRLSPRWQS